MAYYGQVPGLQIRVREGDRVRVVLKNELDQSAAIHFHGVEVPNDQDGVPFITQPPVKAGETYTVHRGASGRFDALEEEAFVYAFILTWLGAH